MQVSLGITSPITIPPLSFYHIITPMSRLSSLQVCTTTALITWNLSTSVFGIWYCFLDCINNNITYMSALSTSSSYGSNTSSSKDTRVCSFTIIWIILVRNFF